MSTNKAKTQLPRSVKPGDVIWILCLLLALLIMLTTSVTMTGKWLLNICTQMMTARPQGYDVLFKDMSTTGIHL